MASKAKKPRKANGYKMPAPIPLGFIVKNNVQKKAWEIGPSIGKGGFGEIYSCKPIEHNKEDTATKVKTPSKTFHPYVMKVEPHENGPLFVEMHFYMRVAKKETIEEWKKSKHISKLGMPCLQGSGTFDYNKERYRYLVMDRYGRDLWSIFLENKKIFPCSTALQIGLQILDVMEYIHDQGYVHCDVKGSNLLLGAQKSSEDQVHVVDFGLASHYNTAPYKPDPKKAHNGTIEYTSRDAHLGVCTRRGDMEILGYNLLHWTTSTLPWDNMTDPKLVQTKKESLMSNVQTAVKKMTSSPPAVVTSYLDYVSKMKHDDGPDYNFCRKLFKQELKKMGVSENDKLTFKTVKTPSKKPQVRKTRAVTTNNYDTSDEDENEPPTPVTPKTPTRSRKVTGPSWKDSATAIASNVVKAGEYVSSNPKPKRQKK